MRTVWTVIIIIILCVIGYFIYIGVATPQTPGGEATTTATGTGVGDQASVSAVVTGFGTQLGMVSTLAATDTVAANMQQYYSAYVAPDLLAEWEANPSVAPGHTTSSPSPDHIDVTSVTANADGTYTVMGNVVEVLESGTASATPSGSFPITATVSDVNGSWLISSWSGYPPANATSSSTQ